MTRPQLLLSLTFLLAGGVQLAAQDSRPARTPEGKTPEPAYPAGAAEEAGITIQRAALEPGSSLEVTSSCDVRFAAEERQGGAVLRGLAEAMSKSARLNLTVTGSEEDGTITSLGFRVREASARGRPVAGAKGLTFSAELDGQGKVLLLDRLAKPLPASALNTLCAGLAGGLLGEPSARLTAPLPKGELKPGAKVRFEDAALIRLLALGRTLKSQEVVYRGTRKVGGRALAVFKLRATTVSKGQSLVIGGEVLIDPKTGLLAGADLLGALTIQRGRKGRTLTAKGEVRIRRQVASD